MKEMTSFCMESKLTNAKTALKQNTISLRLMMTVWAGDFTSSLNFRQIEIITILFQ